MFTRFFGKVSRISTLRYSTFSSLTQIQTIKQSFWSKKIGIFGIIGAGVAFYSATNSLCSDEYYEKIIPANLQNGDKIEVQVGPNEDDSVLVAKVDGQYYCVSNKCPHFGAPLSKGPLFYDKIYCPFHNASFSVKDGATEGGPIMDGLQKFEIIEKKDKLHLRVSKSKLNTPTPMNMVKPNPADRRRYVIIGGGPAGLSAAETLRQAGYTGRITILSNEDEFLPYDRTILSKALFFADMKKLQYRSKEFLITYGINIYRSAEVTEIDPHRRFVQTSDEQHFHYDKLLIATGGVPRRIPVQGVNSKNVYTLRDFQDIDALKASVQKSKKLVVIGASFIGLETAASIKDFLKDKIDVTVVDTANVPYERVLGQEVGSAVQKLHSDNGIKFNLGVGIKEIVEKKGVAQSVVLQNGTILEADTVLIGAGVVPNTQFLGEKLEKDLNGALKTDVFLQTSDERIFAAGDVASYPYHYTGQRTSFEHINSSIYQGYIAALNMVGQKTPVFEIPFFWTRFWNKSLHFTGYASHYDEVHIDGDLQKLEFVAWYLRNDTIVAVSAMNKGPVTMIINEAMKQNVMPTGTDIKKGIVKIEDIKKRVEDRGGRCKCQKTRNCSSAIALQTSQSSPQKGQI